MTTPSAYADWKTVIRLPKSGLLIVGHSRAAERTGFYLPHLKIMFDAGLRSAYSPKLICVTHAHTDHSFMLPLILTHLTTKPSVYVPLEDKQLFQDFLNAANRLNPGGLSEHTLLGVTGGDCLRVDQNNWIHVFQLEHTCPTRGYGLVGTKLKLKPEYAGLGGQQIGALKKSGVEVSDVHEVPLVAYLTDTTISVFERYPEVFNYECIIVECTFLNPKHDASKDSKIGHLAKSDLRHVAWSDLRHIVRDHPSVHWILIHFSMRYSDEEILQTIQADCPNARFTESGAIYIN